MSQPFDEGEHADRVALMLGVRQIKPTLEDGFVS
jgi:hypothetical protein